MYHTYYCSVFIKPVETSVPIQLPAPIPSKAWWCGAFPTGARNGQWLDISCTRNQSCQGSQCCPWAFWDSQEVKKVEGTFSLLTGGAELTVFWDQLKTIISREGHGNSSFGRFPCSQSHAWDVTQAGAFFFHAHLAMKWWDETRSHQCCKLRGY